MSATLHFFTDSNGPVPTSYHASNFEGLRCCVTYSALPHGVLAHLLEPVCRRAEELDTPLEMVHHPLDDSLQGVRLPALSTGVFGFDVLDARHPGYPILLGDAHLKEAARELEAAGETFRQARVLHDRQEKLYLAHMDFSAADLLAEGTVRVLLGSRSGARPGREIHRFFGAATVRGNLDYIPQVTEDLPRRYFIKGRPGTGKSTLLKKVAAAALRRGFDVETYHCSLDPKSLDLVAVRELGFCLLDSTSPHEYFPSREGDMIIDMYAGCVEAGTDELCAEELEQLNSGYRALIQKAREHLQNVDLARQRWEAAQPAPDPAALERERQRLLSLLFGE